MRLKLLSQQEVRVRCYHEAGHALVAFHLGVKVRSIYGEDVARTVYDAESYTTAPARVRAVISLAGGLAEEIVFGERSQDCCTADLKRLKTILDELTSFGPDRNSLRSALESDARDLMKRPAFRGALDVLATWVMEHPLTAGRWAVELLAKKCPEVVPDLQVRPESYAKGLP